MNNAVRSMYRYVRSTPEFHLFAAPAMDGEAPIVYLPKSIFAGIPAPSTLDLIVGTAMIHQCNCQYCNRRQEP